MQNIGRSKSFGRLVLIVIGKKECTKMTLWKGMIFQANQNSAWNIFRLIHKKSQ